MKPLSGLMRESGEEAGRDLMRSLLGFWPVARMTNSVESSVPLFSWTVKGVPLLGKPVSGTTMRAPVTRLK